ncbi:MAG: UMP kinase [Treponema sp.]|jgi:uridylate kinase|nr:UMP kinase [Treponema sp.]
MVTVISLGGSIVAPDGVDEAFLKAFVTLLRELVAEDADRRFIFVVGGGAPARMWQKAYRAIAEQSCNEQADWIGVMATRLNAQLIKAILGDWCKEAVVTNPMEAVSFEGRALVAAGWKPGFSSDYDAVLLAEHFKAAHVINLSNIEQVYTADPRLDPNAKPIDKITWPEFRAMVGNEWVPGKNVPFDPVASAYAQKIGLSVICAAGRNLENLKDLLRGKPFLGTTIG